MDSKLKADWIAALRSGEFKQTRDVMRDDEGFCCLGVLCALMGRDVVNEEIDFALPIERHDNTDNYDYLNIVIGESVRLECAERNDSGGTFRQIADWLESNPDV